ncbi:hypothetical protein N2603_11730 [Bradyrhizobium huanghuaihaiense]|uniref:hypothetical protein n=1 Tax=Bradyrhizobium huanghuaihaiense TaxID=990078 RepID=UPI0021AAA990|nr:hypothetical protein [Bradyrhizobium sp. CB3035]UWU79093.1 hypothetical protein N2603_11730 [Bradyrhizobium sp. CB3035]
MTNQTTNEAIAAGYSEMAPTYIVKPRDDGLNADVPSFLTHVAVPSRDFTKRMRGIEIDRVVSPRKGWRMAEEGYSRFVARQYLVTAERHPSGWTIDRINLHATPGEPSSIAAPEFLCTDEGMPVLYPSLWFAAAAVENAGQLGLTWKAYAGWE